MKKITVLASMLWMMTVGFAVAQQESEKPKIVVGIVVDQMRQEYLYKFSDRYTDGGFKKLVKDGFMMQNAHYNYIPTYTGPGHASVYTGATPATHGIIANNWYVRELERSIYCAEDTTVSYVGGSEKAGLISPRNMKSTTITDELRFASNKRSKTIGIALKDRGAALPAGHLGDAYWYDGNTGEFMTSTYYYDELPQWVQDFNNKKLPAKYLDGNWETLYPIDSYIQSIDDANEFEGNFAGKETTDFPYNLTELQEENGGLGMISSTPFGNTYTLDMAYAAIEGEELGMRGETDFLAVSFSSPDYIGHRFGPTSVELEDNYLRLDQDIEKFLSYLDETYGEGNYLVFLTADHGVADIVEYMKSENVPAGNLDSRFLVTQLKGFANDKFGEGEWIENYSNEQIFLNRKLIAEKGKNLEEMQRALAEYVLKFEGIKEAYTASDLRRSQFIKGRSHLLQMGYNHKASGDVLLIFEPAWLSSSWKGTTHGTGYTYDTHVPILFYGWNIEAGQSAEYCTITDIAPTLAMLLKTRLPNGATGQPLLPVLKK
ncbi:alkaline phosphatase family protein [Litoribacter alkaliphilus]|uniref:Alkaline phosphatase family protein n=1 Tax=Litoribacter ruber TaxID=702568 RepID=A0AAP2CIG9_9BACT|nr:alkaline phosphatase PafA [Litoribacter alkaliphilus]MBS9524279.1 alkaline phosphatase family protein [Litoribacter alkaliphilus]